MVPPGWQKSAECNRLTTHWYPLTTFKLTPGPPLSPTASRALLCGSIVLVPPWHDRFPPWQTCMTTQPALPQGQGCLLN